jgi:hypothetical protein
MEANIKMDLQEIEIVCVCEGGEGMDRYRWPALVNMVMRLQAPKHAGNFMTS